MGEQAEPAEILPSPQLPGDHSPPRQEAPKGPGPWFRPVLALTMVAVATLGAATAYWGALAEHEAISLKLRLTMGRMIEVARWAEYSQQYAAWTALTNDRFEHTKRGKALAERANLVRGAEPERSRFLDLQAQEEFALSRVFYGYTHYLKYPNGDPKVSVTESLAREVAAELRSYGFAVEATPSASAGASASGHADASHAKAQPHAPLSPSAAMWQPLNHEIELAHERVKNLAGAVALFVLALVFFTFADIFTRQHRVAMGLAGVGMLVAAAAIVQTLRFSPSSWVIIAAVLLALAAAIGAAWRGGLFHAEADEGHGLHADEVDGKAMRIAHLFLRPTGTVQSKLVIGLIAIAVLFSALTGVGYAIAAAKREHFALEAFQSQIALAERISQSAATATAGAFEANVAVLRNRVRCASAVQREMLARADAGRYASDLPSVRKEIACKPLEEESAKRTANLLDDSYRLGMGLSPQGYLPREVLAQPYRFDSERSPGKYVYDILYHSLGDNPARLSAMADGYHALSAAWNEQATIYLACLTLFAIALYLFGQGLGVGHAWQSQTFIGFGGLFMVLAFGWALLTWLEAVPAGANHFASTEVPASCRDPAKAGEQAAVSQEARVELSARHFGNGEGYYNTAAQLEPGIASHGYKKAIEALECAVAVRPAFPRAHALLSRTYSRLNSPQANETYSSLPTRSKLKEMLAARQKAYEAFRSGGLSPPAGMPPHEWAFNHLLLALLNGDKGSRQEAIRLLCEHIKADGLPSERAICPNGGTSHARNKSNSVNYLNLALALLASDRPDDAIAVYRLVVGEFELAKNRELTAATLTDLNIVRQFCGKLNAPARCGALEKTVADVKQMLVTGSVNAMAPSAAKLSDVRVWVTASEAGWRAKLDVGQAKPGAAPDKLSVVWYALEPESSDPDQWRVWRAMPALSRTLEVAKLKRGTDGSVEVVEAYFRDQTDCLPAGTYQAELYLNGVLLTGLGLKPVEVKRSSIFRSRELNMTFCHPFTWTVSGGEWKPELVRVLTRQAGQTRATMAVLSTFYAPRGEAAAALAAAHVDRVVREVVAPLGKSPPDGFLKSADAFQGCDKPVPKGAILHKSWVTSEGFVHVALLFGDDTQELCSVLKSIKTYYAPEIVDKRS